MSATESSLVAPFGIDSWVELYDSDIAKIAAGPVHYAQQRSGQSLEIDRFVRDLQEQFFECGFGVQVQVWTTEQEGVYAFMVEIQKRLGPTWDPDQMVHEVTHNLLDLPGEQEGFLDTNEGMAELARKQREHKPHQH
jgi:hypothetical protein